MTVRGFRGAGFGAALLLGGLLAGCADRPVVEPVAGDPPDPSFDIEIRAWPGTTLTDFQRAQIEAAAVRWERVITRGLPAARVSGSIGCGPGSPLIDEEVDDLVVYIRVTDITALAESGPCLLRGGSLLPVIATIWLDGPTRLGQLEPLFLRSLVTHEIGHALGFGTLWRQKGLLADPALEGGLDPHFLGSGARTQFDLIGGSGYTGAKVPVETTGGPGTADSHWRNSVFGDRELMTYSIELGANPLSFVTVQSIGDLGYEVDLDQADVWSLPPAASLAPEGRRVVPLDETVRRGPFVEIGADGRRRRIVRR